MTDNVGFACGEVIPIDHETVNFVYKELLSLPKALCLTSRKSQTRGIFLSFQALCSHQDFVQTIPSLSLSCLHEKSEVNLLQKVQAQHWWN